MSRAKVNESESSHRLNMMVEAFRLRYGTEPTIGARAPGRVDLMGSHTDYNEGFVLTLPIDRDTWILATPRNDDSVNLASLNLDSTCHFSTETFHVKVDGWGQYAQGVAKVLVDSGHKLKGFDGLIHGTVPIASGLSSSASLESALATLFELISGFNLADLQKARLCQQAENEWVGMNCGILDQYSSILGEADAALLLDCRSLTHKCVRLPESLSAVICNTCLPRQLKGSEFGERRSQCESGAAYFSTVQTGINSLRDVSMDLFQRHESKLNSDVRKRSQFIIEENARVIQMSEALEFGNRKRIKSICEASFKGARELFEICVPEMDQMFAAMSSASGHVGCRQAGAGFGGCMSAVVEKDQVDQFCDEVAQTYLRTSRIKPSIFAVQSGPAAGRLTL